MKLLLSWILSLLLSAPLGLSFQFPLPTKNYVQPVMKPIHQDGVETTGISLPIGMIVFASLALLGGGQPAVAADANNLPRASIVVASASAADEGFLNLMGRTAKESLGLISQEEKEARLREFDAKFEQDYQDRNQLYADKLRQKKTKDAEELQQEKQFVGKAQEYSAVTGVPTDRGDSLLPKQGLASGLFPDIFDEKERAKVKAREEEASKNQQENIQRSEAAKLAEEEEKRSEAEKGKLGDDGFVPNLNIVDDDDKKLVQTWEI